MCTAHFPVQSKQPIATFSTHRLQMLRAQTISHVRPAALVTCRRPRRLTCLAMASPKYDIAVKGTPDGKLADCPFCHRALLTLEEKHVPYTKTLVDFNAKPEWLFDVNPKGAVPVMKDLATGEWIVDSGVIADLLEKEVPQPKLGTVEGSPQIGNDVFGAFIQFLKAPEGEKAEKEQALVAALTAVNEYLTQNGPYIGGANVCATDLSLAPKLYHLKVALKHFKGWEIPAGLTAVHRYMNIMAARDSWKNTYYSEDIVVKGWERHLAQH